MSLSGRERAEGFLVVCGHVYRYSLERAEGFLVVCGHVYRYALERAESVQGGLAVEAPLRS